MHYIYIIRNNINNKLYVGQANNLKRRWSRHKSDAKRVPDKMIISRAINKYGAENFTFIPIEEWASLEEINEAEIFWIEFLNSRDPNIGYNIEIGGNKGPVSAETRAKLSAAQKGKPAWNKGKFIISWPENSQLLSMVNANGLSYTARTIGCSPSALCKKLKINKLQHNRPVGNTNTQFKNGSNHPGSKLIPEQVLEIVSLYKTGNYTQTQLAKLFNVDRMNIKKIITGQTWNHLTHIK